MVEDIVQNVAKASPSTSRMEGIPNFSHTLLLPLSHIYKLFYDQFTKVVSSVKKVH